ncbi:MAG: CDF family Co(II)/Ni(II) efflux transporter DmeF [Betaproteobacteria bacterium]|nr:CDF family Co(II)/Ni(II) efflux transporter DmeF [Betaproteobacteria bacterium]
MQNPLCHSPIAHSGSPVAESRTRRVLLLTAATMVLEIAMGWWSGSMALLADGWHMGSHVLALGLSWGAYVLARRHAGDGRFAFGTWKIEVLGGYTSALLLLAIAALMAVESVARLLAPVAVAYDQALAVAALGLGVNLLSAWWLHAPDHDVRAQGHAHGHAHDHDHDHDHSRGHGHPHDLNLRAAYLHVLTDAATSVLAIVALLSGKFLALGWMDPAIGLAGAVVVALWALGLVRDTAAALLDASPSASLVEAVRGTVAAHAPSLRIADLHVWRVGIGRHACIVALQGVGEHDLRGLRRALEGIEGIIHLTLESRPDREPT